MVVAALCARFALGAVFLVAGAHKLGDRGSFAAAVRALDVSPARHAGRVALVLPIVEVGGGAAMAAGLATRSAALLLGTLSAGFAVLLTALLARGRRPACHCFGPASGRTASWLSVLRNLALVGAAVLVAVWSRPVLAVDALWHPAPPTPTTSDALALLVATTAVLLTALIAGALRRLPADATAVSTR